MGERVGLVNQTEEFGILAKTSDGLAFNSLTRMRMMPNAVPTNTPWYLGRTIRSDGYNIEGWMRDTSLNMTLCQNSSAIPTYINGEINICPPFTASLNIRMSPSTDAPLKYATEDRYIQYIGQYSGQDGNWFYVRIGGVEDYGWISMEVLPLANCPNAPLVDAQGNPVATPTPTITPTLAPPTITPTPTPFVTPTLYPTLTPGAPPPTPTFLLCTDRDQWIRDLCYQGWNYLSDVQRQQLTIAVNSSSVTTDFITLDAWWLQNIRRGITDVPPQVWQTESLNQCGGNVNCENIVHNAVYLFENMSRMGVDLNSSGGTGQLTNISDPNSIQPGLLPTGNTPLGAIWGHQVDSLACRGGRFAGFSTYADVCWVCQDLTTELYRMNGIDLEAVIDSDPNFRGYANPVSRLVPTVYSYLQLQNKAIPGGTMPYVVGDIAFLSNALSNNEFQFFHSGIVVRGANVNVSLEVALDQVLIAQMSFSSQGYFTNNGDFVEGDTLFSAERYRGRFEIITLRTYLYKNLLAQNQSVPPNPVDMLNLANIYMAHGRPTELGY